MSKRLYGATPLTRNAVSSTDSENSADCEDGSMVTVGTRVPVEIRHELRKIAYEHSTVSDDVTISDVLRVAIEEFLGSSEDNNE